MLYGTILVVLKLWSCRCCRCTPLVKKPRLLIINNTYYESTEGAAAPMHDPEQSVGFLVNDVARLLRRNFNRRAQELGLSQAQWQALAYLSRQEGVNQVTLADSLEIQPITLARLIDRLQKAGLVARRPDPADRRAFRLYLTAAARSLLERMWQLAVETREEAMAGLADDRKQVLIDALRHMKLNLLAAESGGDSTDKQAERALSNAAGSV